MSTITVPFLPPGDLLGLAYQTLPGFRPQDTMAVVSQRETTDLLQLSCRYTVTL
jgi:hypothetical protein